MVNDPAGSAPGQYDADSSRRTAGAATGGSSASEDAAVLGPDAGRGRVALVTDVTSPIGEAVARDLLRLGCEVWGLDPLQAASPRTPSGDHGALLRSVGVHVVALADVADETLAAVVRKVEEAAGHVDVLVNTLGDPGRGSVDSAAPDDVRRQFDTCVLAPVRLAQLVLPGMRHRAWGRIVFVSGMAGSLTQPSGSWQHAMTAALAATAENLRLEVAPFDVKVSLVEPGPLTTEWAAKARRGLEQRSQGTAYEQPLSQVARLVRRFEGGRFTSSAQSVARVVSQAALSDAPQPRYEVGVGSGATAKVRKLVKDRAVTSLLDALG